jgi:hypothetical protein
MGQGENSKVVCFTKKFLILRPKAAHRTIIPNRRIGETLYYSTSRQFGHIKTGKELSLNKFYKHFVSKDRIQILRDCLKMATFHSPEPSTLGTSDINYFSVSTAGTVGGKYPLLSIDGADGN